MKQTQFVMQEAKIFIMPWLLISILIVIMIAVAIWIIIKANHNKKTLHKTLKTHDSFYLPYENKSMPTKKAPAKKVVAKKAPAKKVVAKKAPAKKVVAKKAPAKKVVAKKK
jgi:hypothetical protein